jgi:hypothetical protein
VAIGTVPNVPDAATIVGLLADDDRRLAFAALILGDRSIDSICERTRLDTERVGRAVARLVTAGLVVQGASGGLHLLTPLFAQAAREANTSKLTADSEHGGLPPEKARVMRAFVKDGRLIQVPSAHGKRLVILDWLVQDFEIGTRYSEPMVNLILGRRHPDTAALRRYLVDEGFLDRAGGEYWRSGGSVPT